MEEEKKEVVEVAQNKEVKSKIVPKIFIKKDEKIQITVVGFHSAQTGELIMIFPLEYVKDDGKDDVFVRKDYTFKFSKVSYDKLNRYRNRSLQYNAEDKTTTINTLKLRQFFLVWHLVDWNLQDEEGNKIPLKFDPNGALSDETLQLIYLLPSSLLDTVLATFEKKMNII